MNTNSIVTDDYKRQVYDWGTKTFLNTSSVDHPTLEWFVKKSLDALNEGKNDSGLPIIIGLCGNAGAGKDSAVEFACQHLNCIKMSFADPIRSIGEIFGFTKEQMSDRTLKETKDAFWGFSPRTFMQKVGTEMFRDCLDQDIWVKLCKKRIIGYTECQEPVPNVIFITDVRFPNEVEMIRSIGGKIFKIHRTGYDKTGVDLHPSERYVQFIDADEDIDNEADNALEWSLLFTKQLCREFKHNAYYYN